MILTITSILKEIEYFCFFSSLKLTFSQNLVFWKYLKTIPKGKVKTYKEVAIALNMPNAARAVANACGKNPYAPKIPCHRVIRSDGSIGGFSAPGGSKTKKKLLKNEGFLV